MERRPHTAGIRLAPDLAEVAHARRFLAEQCDAAGIRGETRETAVLLISETVTNAFIHGRSEARIQVTATAARLRVAVSDDNSRHPSVAREDPEALDGRGIAIIDLLADAWGIDRDPLGKTVWFELQVAEPPGRRAGA